MRKVLVIFICMVALILCVSCSKDEDKYFRVGMECNYTPYNWTQSKESEYTVKIEGGGYADGYDVQLAKMVAEALGKELVIVKTEWDGLTMSLTSGNIDAIIAGMTPTDERRMTIDFTEPYWTTEYGMIVRKDSKYADATELGDFSDAVLTGQLNTSLYDMLLQIPGVNRKTAMESFPAMTVAVQSGAVDGFITFGEGGAAITKSNPDLAYVSFEEGKGFDYEIEETAAAIGLRKDDPNFESINNIVKSITKEKRMQMMAEAIDRQPIE